MCICLCQALDKAIKLEENDAPYQNTKALLNERSIMVRLKLLGQALSLLVMICPPLADADVLDDILDRGTIRVGVSEFVPWTIRTKSG